MNPRINELKLNQNKILTNHALGFSQESYIGKALMPQVGVDDTKVTIPSYAKDLFRVYKTERALRAEAQVLDPASYDKKEISLYEHAIAQRLDTWEIAASGVQRLNLLRYASMQVTEALTLGEEVRIADMLQDLNTYATGNKVTLSGDTQWTDVDSDPLTQIDTAKEKISSQIAKYPTVIAFGHDSFKSFKDHKKVRDAIFGVDKPGIPTISQIEQLLGMKVYVGRSKYATSSNGAFINVWEDNCILAYIPQTAADKANLFTPSFAYSFQHNGFPIIQDFFTSGNKKVKQVEATTVSSVAVLMDNAGYLIKDTNA